MGDAIEPDATVDDGGRPCGVWTCTGTQRCVETCFGHDVGLPSDFQCVDVPAARAATGCACLAALDPCITCAAPSLPCEHCPAPP